MSAIAKYNRPLMVHALPFCEDCDYEGSENFIDVPRSAREHARKTGHTVRVETGYTQTYYGKEVVK